MELYFIRHAIAVDRLDPNVNNDETRWLTDEGIKRMEKAVRGLTNLVEKLDLIYTSHYIRAKQTAEIVAKAMGKKTKIVTTADLAPGVDFSAFLELAQKEENAERIAFVGHEPDMSNLISNCISGGTAEIEMKKGSICRVDFHDKPAKSEGTLIWLLPPKALRGLA